MKKILTAGLSPAIQKVILLETLEKNEVNRSTEYIINASGKSINTCRVLIQAGMDAEALVPVGIESLGQFSDLCSKENIPLSVSKTSGRVRTCYTLIGLNDKSCTEIVSNEPEIISGDEEIEFCRIFNEKLETAACVIVSGSRFRGFSENIIPFMMKETLKRNITFIADYKGDDLENSLVNEKIRPDYIKINKSELLQTFGNKGDSIQEIINILSKKYRNTFIITSGKGKILFSDCGNLSEVNSLKINAVNPIGSGDSFTAGLAEGIIKKYSLQKAVETGRDYASRNALSLHPGWIK